MADEGKPPESGSQTDAPVTAPPDQARANQPSSLSADAEKDAQVEAAKARVEKKEEGPKPVDASEHPLVKRLKQKFGESVIDASEFLGQLSVRIARSRIVEVCDALKMDSQTPFEYLSDLTCVHY